MPSIGSWNSTTESHLLLIDFQNLILRGKTNKHKKEGLKLWFLRFKYENQGAVAEKKGYVPGKNSSILDQIIGYWIPADM